MASVLIAISNQLCWTSSEKQQMWKLYLHTLSQSLSKGCLLQRLATQQSRDQGQMPMRSPGPCFRKRKPKRLCRSLPSRQVQGFLVATSTKLSSDALKLLPNLAIRKQARKSKRDLNNKYLNSVYCSVQVLQQEKHS